MAKLRSLEAVSQAFGLDPADLANWALGHNVERVGGQYVFQPQDLEALSEEFELGLESDEEDGGSSDDEDIEEFDEDDEEDGLEDVDADEGLDDDEDRGDAEDCEADDDESEYDD